MEEKLTQFKKEAEALRLANEKPTQDNAKSSTPSDSAKFSSVSGSEEVLQLHEQMTEMHAQMTAMENQNMETVALLKQENRKLAKQLKQAE